MNINEIEHLDMVEKIWLINFLIRINQRRFEKARDILDGRNVK